MLYTFVYLCELSHKEIQHQILKFSLIAYACAVKFYKVDQFFVNSIAGLYFVSTATPLAPNKYCVKLVI